MSVKILTTADVKALAGAVAVAIDNSRKFRHTGIALRWNGRSTFYHLAWHRELSTEDLGDDYLWVVVRMPATRIPVLAARLRNATSQKNKDTFSYGLRFQASRVTNAGALSVGQNETGLTCATFVVAMLQAAGIQFIDVQTWLSRDSDNGFHNWVVNRLKSQISNVATALEVRNELENLKTKLSAEVGSPRIRPIEVAASVVHTEWPTSFEAAKAIATEIQNMTEVKSDVETKVGE